ncbi:hypothetical protein DAKH74_057130 [Maudiozyma humilis]|uniref:SWIRM domain-containing protein n=1 Tax=Maudiozyma humilis TaxID=51915 RepID=A0AAV5SA31_MAUHU|nr:hypothetical protein DAKH74_057130 [Kazachstania humilis]
MESNSPRPEHLQLSGTVAYAKTDALLSALNRRVQFAALNEGSSSSSNNANSPHGIDGLLEDRSIPSPPQSPRLTFVHTNVAQSSIPDMHIAPTWSQGQTMKRYRHSMSTFLQGYKMFRSETTHRNYTTSPSHSATRAKKTYKSPASSDVERVYRTRRVARESGKSKDEPAEALLASPSPAPRVRPKTPAPEPRVVKPRTPSTQPHRRHHAPVTSPLASAAVLAGSQSAHAPNMAWEKLPDYAPPTSTLPANNVKCLKVEWKGSPMNLSNDPLRNRLHPAELVLAQVLRLPCDLYLDSKRRLFLEKVCRMKKGLTFRRTDAQKACRIDVNKASRLYAAYEKVGWLADENFKSFV